MRLFQYEVTDRSGNVLQGNLQAQTSDAARLALSNAGYTVKNVRESGSVAAKPRVAKLPSPPRTTDAPKIEAPRPVQLATPAAMTKRDTVRTGWLNDRHLFLMFAQLGSMLKAGVNLSRALQDLSTRVGTKRMLPESLREAAARVSEGGSMCDTFERYPYFYPPDVVSTLRAAEMGGFLPIACAEISQQRELSRKFTNVFRIFFYYFLVILCFAPILGAFVSGSLKSIAAQDKAGGMLPIVPTLLKYLQHESGPLIFWLLALIGGSVAAYFVWHSMPLRMMRHTLVLKIPGIAGRTKAESLNRFFFVLGELTRAGISGHRALEAAAASVVNLRLREDLMQQTWALKENESISSALRRSAEWDRSYVDIVENGELTGNVPAALDAVARDCRSDFEYRDRVARTVAIGIAYSLIAVATVVILATMYSSLYGGLIKTLTQE